MADKVITAINLALINDSELGNLVGKNSFGDVAIYDNWAEEEREFPYVVLSWAFDESYHWGRRKGLLEVDIFTRGSSSVEAENIRDRIVEILDRQKFESEQSGKISCYLADENIIPDIPDVTHWKVRFDIYFWRKGFINKLLNG